MESTQYSDRATFRVIVLRQGGSELLLVPAAGGFALPVVVIPRWQRVAENMVGAIKNEWSEEAICLFNPDLGVPTSSHYYQVMECSGPATSQSRGEWIPVSSLSERTFADPTDQVAVLHTLSECQAHPGVGESGPFAKLGWFRDLQEWIEEAIGPLGFHLTGSFSQLNAGPSFSLVRFATSGPAVWFKAVGEPNRREVPITLKLAELFPRYLPSVLAARPEWNGWLTMEVDGANLSETQGTGHWNVAASTLAKLQVESTDKIEALINSGARDLRASGLLKLVHPLLDVTNQLMENQTNVTPRVLSRNELTLLEEQIVEALSLFADLKIPDALGHLDLNPANVIVSDGRCVFLDWAEAYVGNPLFSFEYLLEHCRRRTGEAAIAESDLAGIYAAPWQSLVSPESLNQALSLTPMLAVFSYAVATDTWNDRARLQDPNVAGYLRSLVRRMHREASRLKNRGALWPN